MLIIEVPRVLLPRTSTTTARLSTFTNNGDRHKTEAEELEHCCTSVVNILVYFFCQRKTERERDDPHSPLDGQSPQHANVCS